MTHSENEGKQQAMARILKKYRHISNQTTDHDDWTKEEKTYSHLTPATCHPAEDPSFAERKPLFSKKVQDIRNDFAEACHLVQLENLAKGIQPLFHEQRYIHRSYDEVFEPYMDVSRDMLHEYHNRIEIRRYDHRQKKAA